mmetsp:Transcript_24215/g.84077  ORF Transcript_24215/g.84077 Transcript_24215/m.84077 type:complete len:204 (+) Transcript_24215:360-971(+)
MLQVDPVCDAPAAADAAAAELVVEPRQSSVLAGALPVGEEGAGRQHLGRSCRQHVARRDAPGRVLRLVVAARRHRQRGLHTEPVSRVLGRNVAGGVPGRVYALRAVRRREAAVRVGALAGVVRELRARRAAHFALRVPADDEGDGGRRVGAAVPGVRLRVTLHRAPQVRHAVHLHVPVLGVVALPPHRAPCRRGADDVLPLLP